MKNNQKGFVIPLIIALVAILAIGGGVFIYKNKKAEAPEINIPNNMSDQTATTTNPIIGGDRDEHGCLGPAGYSWCAEKNKCLRVWEEKCEVETIIPECKIDADCPQLISNGPMFPINRCINSKCVLERQTTCTADAKQCPDGSYVGRSGPDCEFVCPNSSNVKCTSEGGLIYFGMSIECCSGLIPVNINRDPNLVDTPTRCEKP